MAQKPLGLTPKQLELRRGVMGGTDAAAIFGVSRYKNAWDVWSEKVEGPEPRGEPGEDAAWGLLLEPVIRAEYARRTGLSTRKPARLIRNVDRRWQAGHLDGLAGDGVLEIKVRWSHRGWGDPGSDEIPPEVRVQVEHYLAVTGRPWADVAVLFGGQRLETFRVEASSDAIGYLTEEEAAWWQRHVVEREPPEIDGSASAERALRRRYPTDDGSVATIGQSAIVSEYLSARRATADAERREAALKQTIMATMETATKLLAPDATITWSQATDSEKVDWKSYAAHLEGLLNGQAEGVRDIYTTKVAGSRRFTVRETTSRREIAE